MTPQDYLIVKLGLQFVGPICIFFFIFYLMIMIKEFKDFNRRMLIVFSAVLIVDLILGIAYLLTFTNYWPSK